MWRQCGTRAPQAGITREASTQATGGVEIGTVVTLSTAQLDGRLRKAPFGERTQKGNSGSHWGGWVAVVVPPEDDGQVHAVHHHMYKPQSQGDGFAALPMTSYTCTACASTFQSSEEQRAHYKLDWHRYNLKRKVASLAPVSKEDFERRLAAIAGAAVTKSDYRGHCKECRKSFGSEKLYAQHLETKKHQQVVAANAKKAITAASPAAAAGGSEGPILQDTLEADMPAPEVSSAAAAAAETPAQSGSNAAATSGGSTLSQDTGAAAAGTSHAAKAAAAMDEDGDKSDGDDDDDGPEPPLGAHICVFCNKEARDVADNCAHMLAAHGFFIPDAEYLVDRAGLVAYCGEKVKLGRLCLVCNGRGRGFRGWRAVQQHMADVGHCRLCYEEGEDLHEFEPFYDFRPSYGEGDVMEDGEGGDAGLAGVPQIEVTHLGELQLLDGRVVGHRQYDRIWRLIEYHAQRVNQGRSCVSPQVQHGINVLAPPWRALSSSQVLQAGSAESRHAREHRGRAPRAGAAARQRRRRDARGQSGFGAQGGGGALMARGGARGGGAGGFAGPREMHQVRRAQWLAQREALKLGIKQNKLNRTFTRVFEC
ncbi:C2H2 type zinc-finger-domain-containing protein [Tribonema minus]|uniref:C2H2 type zinc-finger-domain-containing protein n=1 Tax=Tribonema minus TaxID=303371 RepID=A0A835YRS1_9STRA|nr:C2H2 type zinc-finger-domain-containing protein [Tribonema minus]